MHRYHQETHIVRRNYRNHLRFHRWSLLDSDSNCEHQAGRFRKKDAYDCGNARCYLCHSDKLLGRPTFVESVARLSAREQIDEARLPLRVTYPNRR
jgi:hypothetical protein